MSSSSSPPEAYARARLLIDEVHSKDPASVRLSSLPPFLPYLVWARASSHLPFPPSFLSFFSLRSIWTHSSSSGTLMPWSHGMSCPSVLADVRAQSWLRARWLESMVQRTQRLQPTASSSLLLAA